MDYMIKAPRQLCLRRNASHLCCLQSSSVVENEKYLLYCIISDVLHLDMVVVYYLMCPTSGRVVERFVRDSAGGFKYPSVGLGLVRAHAL